MISMGECLSLLILLSRAIFIVVILVVEILEYYILQYELHFKWTAL